VGAMGKEEEEEEEEEGGGPGGLGAEEEFMRAGAGGGGGAGGRVWGRPSGTIESSAKAASCVCMFVGEWMWFSKKRKRERKNKKKVTNQTYVFWKNKKGLKITLGRFWDWLGLGLDDWGTGRDPLSPFV
jgi:hypothetical protein